MQNVDMTSMLDLHLLWTCMMHYKLAVHVHKVLYVGQVDDCHNNGQLDGDILRDNNYFMIIDKVINQDENLLLVLIVDIVAY